MAQQVFDCLTRERESVYVGPDLVSWIELVSSLIPFGVFGNELTQYVPFSDQMFACIGHFIVDPVTDCE